MRLSEEKIRQAILHSQEEVRLTAVRYFADSFSPDESIMPFVIQAIEKYGRPSAFRLLRVAERLVQTAPTLDWHINELRRDYDPQIAAADNLRFALALVTLAAPIDLLGNRKAQIDSLLNYPAELRSPLDERLRMASWGLEQCWEALEEVGRRAMKRGEYTRNETRYLGRIIESLAQYPDERGDMVVALLGKDYTGKSNRLMDWLESDIITLAGEMRLEAAIPILIGHLDSDDLNLADAATTALIRIGTDAVVEAIAENWFDESDDFRGGAADVLDKIHTDLSVHSCLDFLDTEEDLDTALALGHALLSHFSFEGIEPVRELLLEEEELTPDHFDLWYHLIAAATIMGVTFPDYDALYQDAVETNWGSGDREPFRLADAFRPDPVGPSLSGNGKG